MKNRILKPGCTPLSVKDAHSKHPNKQPLLTVSLGRFDSGKGTSVARV